MEEKQGLNVKNYSASISDPETGNQDNFNARVYGKEADSNNMLPRRQAGILGSHVFLGCTPWTNLPSVISRPLCSPAQQSTSKPPGLKFLPGSSSLSSASRGWAGNPTQ